MTRGRTERSGRGFAGNHERDRKSCHRIGVLNGSGEFSDGKNAERAKLVSERIKKTHRHDGGRFGTLLDNVERLRRRGRVSELCDRRTVLPHFRHVFGMNARTNPERMNPVFFFDERYGRMRSFVVERHGAFPIRKHVLPLREHQSQR